MSAAASAATCTVGGHRAHMVFMQCNAPTASQKHWRSELSRGGAMLGNASCTRMLCAADGTNGALCPCSTACLPHLRQRLHIAHQVARPQLRQQRQDLQAGRQAGGQS